MDSAYMTVKLEGWIGIDDSRYNGDMDASGDQHDVRQNVSMYYLDVQYVVWLKNSFRAILEKYTEPSHENIC